MHVLACVSLTCMHPQMHSPAPGSWQATGDLVLAGIFSHWALMLPLPMYMCQSQFLSPGLRCGQIYFAQPQVLLNLSFIFHRRVFIFLGSFNPAVKSQVVRPEGSLEVH